MPGPFNTVRANARYMSEQNPRQFRLVEEIIRKILPMVLVRSTLRQARPENNVRKMHFRGPLGIHLILDANHSEETGRSYINLRRGKEWEVQFSCLPNEKMFGLLETEHHVGADGETYDYNPAHPSNLPFYKSSSSNLSIRRGEIGRGMKLPTYVNLAYWMVEFGEIAYIEHVFNIEAAERDIIALLVEKA